MNNLIIFLSVIIVLGFATPAFADIHDIVIFSEGREYFIGEITEERKYRLSSITKVQGLTTTGEMFFIFTSSNFEKVMLLDRSGHWLKAELQEKTTTPEPIIEEIVEQVYKPDLLLTSSHDFRTFWQDTFNIDVQAFDGNINSNPTSSDFDGRINGVDVKVLLSLDDIQVATLSGVTTNGEWQGEYFFKENISAPGEYAVDVIISYLGETVSKSSSMFVIADVVGGDSGNHAPIANAGPDQLFASSPVTLDGTSSSDPDGDAITFFWVKTSGIDGSLSGTTSDTATFTTGLTGIAVFELTVTDIKGKSSTDSVTITVV